MFWDSTLSNRQILHQTYVCTTLGMQYNFIYTPNIIVEDMFRSLVNLEKNCRCSSHFIQLYDNICFNEGVRDAAVLVRRT